VVSGVKCSSPTLLDEPVVSACLALLAPIVVGIITFHIALAPEHWPGHVVAVMELYWPGRIAGAFRPSRFARKNNAGAKTDGKIP